MDAKFLDIWVRLAGSRYQGVVARIAARVMPKPADQRARTSR